MKRLIVFLLCVVLFYKFFTLKSYAIYDPLSKPNNFYGIHILFPEELEDAARLVNTTNGQWGYVTVPIQYKDRDLEKWQYFMDRSHELKLIPLVRLMTEQIGESNSYWRIPTEYDLVDFSNFLNSLNWPTKNRYVILFNEVNRFDEWGGEAPDPLLYASLVKSAHGIFKDRSEDFFLILGGLDNASINVNSKYINSYTYLQNMQAAYPDVFDSIDGFSSHSYPNPAFSQPPSPAKKVGVSTYKYEYDFINLHATSKKYAFITETGWDSSRIDEQIVASYYKETFEDIWGPDRDKIVAITPFLIRSENGQFDIFSFFKNGQAKPYHAQIVELPKVKGEPIAIARPKQTIYRSPLRKVLDRSGHANISPTPENAEVLGSNSFVKAYFKTILRLDN